MANYEVTLDDGSRRTVEAGGFHVVDGNLVFTTGGGYQRASIAFARGFWSAVIQTS